MNYLIAVLADRIEAEEAAVALEKAGIPQSQVTILGRGYKSADEFGLIDPFQQAKKRATLMAFWLIPFGFAGGYLFNLITGLHTFIGRENRAIISWAALLGRLGGRWAVFSSVVAWGCRPAVAMHFPIAIVSVRKIYYCRAGFRKLEKSSDSYPASI